MSVRAIAHPSQPGSIPCRTCKSQGVIDNGRHLQTCPMCEGAGNVQLTPARIPVFYVIPFTIAAGNGTTQVVQQIKEQADFEWVFTMSVQTSSSLNVTLVDNGAGGYMITNPGTNQNPSQGVCPIACLAGTAQNPFPFLEPYILARATTLTAIFTDTSGAPNTGFMVLQGFSLIPQNAPQQGAAGMIVNR